MLNRRTKEPVSFPSNKQVQCGLCAGMCSVLLTVKMAKYYNQQVRWDEQRIFAKFLAGRTAS